jgi:hypothetical protein
MVVLGRPADAAGRAPVLDLELHPQSPANATTTATAVVTCLPWRTGSQWQDNLPATVGWAQPFLI